MDNKSVAMELSSEEALLVMAWRRLNREGKVYIAHTLLLRQNFEEAGKGRRRE